MKYIVILKKKCIIYLFQIFYNNIESIIYVIILYSTNSRYWSIRCKVLWKSVQSDPKVQDSVVL